jgi:hypothetical protein
MPCRHIAVAIATAITTAWWCSSPAVAGGVFLDVPMSRIFVCKGSDATMEIYAPQSLVLKRNIEKQGLGGTVTGLYALDLTESKKGKVLEPVRLRSTKDNRSIVIEQFTRKGLKPATIPLAGGILDFDQRFGAGARCEAFSPS